MKSKGLKIVFVCIIISVGLIGYFLKNSAKIDLTVNDRNKVKQSVKTANTNEPKTVQDREFKGNVIYNNNSIPVLMFHSIDYEKGNELRVPKDVFRDRMKFLKDNGYTTLTLSEFYRFLHENRPVPKKSVLITFDDGYEDNYVNAYPILKEFGFHATIFVITSGTDKDRRCLTSNQLKEMNKNGIDIESHTVNHDDLGKLNYEKQIETLKNSKEFLEKILDKKIDYIAYPFGHFNGYTVKAVQSAGYKMAFTTESGWANKSQGMYTLHRVYVGANHSLEEFGKRLSNPNYYTAN